MAKLSKLVSVLGAVCAIGSAQALNVGGVVWDPNDFLDFRTTDFMIETIVAPVPGSTLQGYARITSLNGDAPTVFCPGCELTYTFSGYTVSQVDPVTGGLTFSGGTINVYVDSTPDFDDASALSAGDGVLWLSLSGHSHVDAITGLIGTLHSSATPPDAEAAGAGRGYLDVTGGLAAAFFDTNTRITQDTPGVPGTADFRFTSSFQLLDGPLVSDDGVTYGLFGSNDLRGDSIAVPEPSTLLLGGLALVAAGLGRRAQKR